MEPKSGGAIKRRVATLSDHNVSFRVRDAQLRSDAA